MLFLPALPLEGELKAVVDMLAGRLGMEYDGSSLGIAMSDELSGPLTVNLGVIRKEGERVQVKLNYRYPVTRRFEECGPKVRAAFEEAGFRRSHILHKEALYMPADSPLVSRLMRVYAQYTGRQDPPKCIGGGTYAKMIPNTLAFGPVFPGDEVREHKPDEYMELSRLMDNTKILACARKIITRIDLDGPVLCSEDPVLGGAVFEEQLITVSDEPGLGIKGVEGIRYLA